MNAYLKLAAGFICLLFGLGYLYRPALIERVLTLLRDILLNDIHQVLERKKWGIFFLLLSFFFFYMGLSTLFNFR